MSRTSKMPFLILALDGGGARVLLQLRILTRILAQHPELLSVVSVYAGTSAGAILAAGLACGMGPFIDQIITPANIKFIFRPKSAWRRSRLYRFLTMRGILRAKHDNEALDHLLRDHFGSVPVNEVPRALFVPAFSTVGRHQCEDNDCDAAQRPHKGSIGLSSEHLTAPSSPDWMNTRCERWHNVFYHNLNDRSSHIPVARAVLKSGAAPYYLPMVGHTVDGGVSHNNPSMAILSHLLAMGIPLEEIHILSIGTGEKPEQMDVRRDASLGLVQWLPHLMSMIFDANEEATSQSCYEILGDRFHRVNPVLEHTIPLDTTDDAQLAELLRVADAAPLEQTMQWVDNLMH